MGEGRGEGNSASNCLSGFVLQPRQVPNPPCGLFVSPELLALALAHGLFTALGQHRADDMASQKNHHANRNEGDNGDCYRSGDGAKEYSNHGSGDTRCLYTYFGPFVYPY